MRYKEIRVPNTPFTKKLYHVNDSVEGRVISLEDNPNLGCKRLLMVNDETEERYYFNLNFYQGKEFINKVSRLGLDLTNKKIKILLSSKEKVKISTYEEGIIINYRFFIEE